MRTKKFIYALCGLVAATLASGCSSKEFDEPAEPTREVYSYTLNLDLDFKATPDENDALSRAAMESIPDGAQIFMSFHLGEQADAESFTSHEPAYALYNSDRDEWTLYTKTELQANTFGAVTAYYFGPDYKNDSFESLTLDPTKPAFHGVAQYTMLANNSVNMEVSLQPVGIRVRFRHNTSLYNVTKVSEFICPAEWDRTTNDRIHYQFMPDITSWESGGDGYYYTPYYTCSLYGNTNVPFFRIYSNSLSPSVRLFTISDNVYIGETYTIDLTDSAARSASQNSWTFYDLRLEFANQSAPGTPLVVDPQASMYSMVGLHVKMDFSIHSVAQEGSGYTNRIGLRFGSFESGGTEYLDTYFTTATYQAGDSGTLEFDYFNPDLNPSYSIYYKLYFVTDGIDVTFSNISVTRF